MSPTTDDEEGCQMKPVTATPSWGSDAVTAVPSGTSMASTTLPYLLGRKSSNQIPALTVKVKNTFIEAYASDDSSDAEDEDELTMMPMGKSYTCPGRSNSSTLSEDEDLGSSTEQPEKLTKSMRWQLLKVQMQEEEDLVAAGEESKPEEERQPQESIGAAGHGAGDCRPCAWFWRPQGCTNGAECRHCHMCPPGEVKKRRKANRHAQARQRQSDADPTEGDWDARRAGGSAAGGLLAAAS